MSKPFAIYDVATLGKARIAICPQPEDTNAMSLVRDWHPDTIVTLTQSQEFPSGFDMAKQLQNTCKQWHHLPLQDFGIPTADDATLFTTAISELNHQVSHGNRILIHCKGGKGRSGMLALRLMINARIDPDQALEDLRLARAGAVETDDQLHWAKTGLGSS